MTSGVQRSPSLTLFRFNIRPSRASQAGLATHVANGYKLGHATGSFGMPFLTNALRHLKLWELVWRSPRHWKGADFHNSHQAAVGYLHVQSETPRTARSDRRLVFTLWRRSKASVDMCPWGGGRGRGLGLGLRVVQEGVRLSRALSVPSKSLDNRWSVPSPGGQGCERESGRNKPGRLGVSQVEENY